MKIALIDGVNQDIGLNILFPTADYYINNTETDKSNNMRQHNITPLYDWTNITDKKYDYLFIIISLYDAKPGTPFFKQNIYDILTREIEIINNNDFKGVFIFDNYDYDYDPNDILQNKKITLFFKRNYNKTKAYNTNVVPFPFIMFGDTSIIEKISSPPLQQTSNKIKRIFFSGTLFNHEDHQLKWYRNRYIIYNKIKHMIYNPGNIPYHHFLELLAESSFALDLNGVGDPNKRTFEILAQGSLRMSEYNNLKWPFEESFSEETIFTDADSFMHKIQLLAMNDEVYSKCIDNQNFIYNKYFNVNWIRWYILDNICG